MSERRGEPHRRALLVAPALLAIAALLPALAAGFVHDDGPQIVHNPLLHDLGRLPELWGTSVWAGAGSGSSWYRPVMMTAFALERALFGLDPRAMHAVSLLLYAGVVALGVILAPVRPERRDCAALAVALFAVHPLNAEAAVWLSARNELLAAGFGLLALGAHRRARDGGGRPALLRGASGAALALALLSKESAVVFPLVMLADDWNARAGFSPRSLARRYAAPLLAAVGYLAARTAALGDPAGGVFAPFAPGDALGALGEAARRLLWPVGLTISPAPPAPVWAGLGAVLLGAFAGALAWAARRRSPGLVPLTLGLAQLLVAALAATRVGELADRYLLLFVLAAAWGLALALQELGAAGLRRAGVGIAGLVLVLGAGAWTQAGVFRSDATLWEHAVERNPASARAVLNLASARLGGGRPHEALALLERAEALSPGDPQVALNRAAAAWALGDAAAARAILEALRERRPADPTVLTNLGHLALEEDAFAEAADHYRGAVRLNPLSAEAWAGLGVAHQRLGRREEARTALEQALRLDPAVQNAALLRRLLESEGRP